MSRCPSPDAAAPSAVNTRVNPATKPSTPRSTPLTRPGAPVSTSAADNPDTIDTYPGTRGSTQGERNDNMPAPNATMSPSGSAAMLLCTATCAPCTATCPALVITSTPAACMPAAASGPSAPLRANQGQVGVDHHRDQLREVDGHLPSQLTSRFGGVPHEDVDLGRAHQLVVHDHVLTPVEPDVGEGDLAQLADRVRDPG